DRAIAHSTWFQASVWPSGQPMAPAGSWTAAMLSAVARTPAASSTPGTVGTAARARGPGPAWAAPSRTGMRALRAARPAPRPHPPGGGLAGVEHQALADERVQRPLGQPGGGWALHDVPHQQPVVGAGQRMVVVAHPDRALEPPVGRVQAVRVVM